MSRYFLTLLITFALCSRIGAAPAASAATLTTDTTWAGKITLAEDLLIPPGITLTIKPGTTINVTTADNTKTDPEFLSPLTEITVRGTLRAEGTAALPINFVSATPGKPGSWAGILIDGGNAALDNTGIYAAETGIQLFSGTVRLRDSRVQQNQTGIVAIGPASVLTLERATISDNDYGLVRISNPRISSTNLTISGNRKENERSASVGSLPLPTQKELPPTPVAKEVGDTALAGDTLWSGRIRVNGQVRVPEGSRLAIAPGAVIEFTRRDTNGDGIGENGLLIQGTLIAKGTASAPITFRSAETTGRTGDWDGVNIMNSDGARNLIEHCRFSDAYRGLHFHFSHVLVSDSDFRNTYRGIQFQESDVEIVASTFAANRSGVQGRDSRVSFHANRLTGNHTGVNFLRCDLLLAENAMDGNLREGGRIREGTALVERNRMVGNRIGLQVADLFRAEILGNDLAGNTDTGLAMKNVDNLEVRGNHLGGNGINGLNLQEARATIRDNLLTANRQRGIGIISFSGSISGNSFAGNGLYAIENEGSDEVDARGNWWGGADPAKVILDNATDPRRGKVRTDMSLAAAAAFTWPVPQITADTRWSGQIRLPQRASVRQGATLTIDPGTKVAFGPGSGLAINGRLIANGSKTARIVFTSATKQEPESWDELILENATDSQITFTDIQYATWGIHSHFTNLLVSDVALHHNYGGMRFRSGPVLIRRASVHDNSIGIRSYMGQGEIIDSRIADNDIGIFVRERGGSLAIHRNQITGNRNYNLRVGDFNTEDVPAQHNWWGEGNPADTIFDDRREPGIGRVLFEPFLDRSPLTAGGER